MPECIDSTESAPIVIWGDLDDCSISVPMSELTDLAVNGDASLHGLASSLPRILESSNEMTAEEYVELVRQRYEIAMVGLRRQRDQTAGHRRNRGRLYPNPDERRPSRDPVGSHGRVMSRPSKREAQEAPPFTSFKQPGGELEEEETTRRPDPPETENTAAKRILSPEIEKQEEHKDSERCEKEEESWLCWQISYLQAQLHRRDYSHISETHQRCPLPALEHQKNCDPCGQHYGAVTSMKPDPPDELKLSQRMAAAQLKDETIGSELVALRRQQDLYLCQTNNHQHLYPDISNSKNEVFVRRRSTLRTNKEKVRFGPFKSGSYHRAPRRCCLRPKRCVQDTRLGTFPDPNTDTATASFESCNHSSRPSSKKSRSNFADAQIEAFAQPELLRSGRLVDDDVAASGWQRHRGYPGELYPGELYPGDPRQAGAYPVNAGFAENDDEASVTAQSQATDEDDNDPVEPVAYAVSATLVEDNQDEIVRQVQQMRSDLLRVVEYQQNQRSSRRRRRFNLSLGALLCWRNRLESSAL